MGTARSPVQPASQQWHHQPDRASRAGVLPCGRERTSTAVSATEAVMATIPRAFRQDTRAGQRPGYPAGGRGFDRAATALGGWLIGGVYLDGWAHRHRANLETFFTPWHAVLYAGFLALFA